MIEVYPTIRDASIRNVSISENIAAVEATEAADTVADMGPLLDEAGYTILDEYGRVIYGD